MSFAVTYSTGNSISVATPNYSQVNDVYNSYTSPSSLSWVSIYNIGQSLTTLTDDIINTGRTCQTIGVPNYQNMTFKAHVVS